MVNAMSLSLIVNQEGGRKWRLQTGTVMQQKEIGVWALVYLLPDHLTDSHGRHDGEQRECNTYHILPNFVTACSVVMLVKRVSNSAPCVLLVHRHRAKLPGVSTERRPPQRVQ